MGSSQPLFSHSFFSWRITRRLIDDVEWMIMGITMTMIRRDDHGKCTVSEMQDKTYLANKVLLETTQYVSSEFWKKYRERWREIARGCKKYKTVKRKDVSRSLSVRRIIFYGSDYGHPIFNFYQLKLNNFKPIGISRYR